MSAVCIIAPIVIASWPAFSAAVVAAASSLGYVVAEEVNLLNQAQDEAAQAVNRVELQLENSELVTSQLAREQKISVTREGVTLTFSRDARGKASLCVTGQGHTEAALRALGEELSHRVIQKYVYQKLIDEMRTRQFMVVQEETDATQAIHLTVRHWDN